MAKLITSKNADQYVEALEKLDANTVDNLGRVIYPAAGIVADEIKKNIRSLPINAKGERGTTANPIDGVTAAQRTGLEQGMGIAKIQNKDGYVNVKIGFDGYNSQASNGSHTKGKTWTHRQANIVIARSVEHGTSFRRAHPFVAPAVRASQQRAKEEMEKQIEAQLKKMGF
jgi:HK97 gp10 family phage protein